MGNINTHLECDNRNYCFVGRQEDVKKICKHIEGTKKLVVQISGMQEVGKSRVLTQVLKIYHPMRKCVFIDLSFEGSTFNSSAVANCINRLQEALGFSVDETDNDNITIQDLTRKVLRKIESLDDNIVLFIDNVDNAFHCDGFKDSFLQFIKDVCVYGNSGFKVVFTSAVRSQLTSNAFVDHEIKVLSDTAIQMLFYKVIKEKASDCDDASFEEENYDLSDDLHDLDQDNDGLQMDKGDDDSLFKQIMSPSNMIFINALVKLCSGLPTLAIMMGSELAANDGLIEPRDMVVLIIEDILKTLSPDCYPKSDKAAIFQEAIKKVEKRRELLYEMNRYLDEANVGGVDSVVKADESAKSEAEAKQNTRDLLDYNVVMYSRKGKQFKIPAIFRECLLAMKPLEKENENEKEINKEDEHIRDLLKLGRLKLADIPGLPEDVINSPEELEEFLHSLEDSPEQKMSHLISQPSQDDEDDTAILSTSHDTGEMKRLFNTVRQGHHDAKYTRQNDPVEKGVHDDMEDIVENRNLNSVGNGIETRVFGESRIDSVSGPEAISYRELSDRNPTPICTNNNLNDLSIKNRAQVSAGKYPLNDLDKEVVVSTNMSACMHKQKERVVERVEGDVRAGRSSSVEDNSQYDSYGSLGIEVLQCDENDADSLSHNNENTAAGRDLTNKSTKQHEKDNNQTLNKTQREFTGTGVKMKESAHDYASSLNGTQPRISSSAYRTSDSSPNYPKQTADMKANIMEHGGKRPDESENVQGTCTEVDPGHSVSLFDSD